MNIENHKITRLQNYVSKELVNNKKLCFHNFIRIKNNLLTSLIAIGPVRWMVSGLIHFFVTIFYPITARNFGKRRFLIYHELWITNYPFTWTGNLTQLGYFAIFN